MLCHSADPKQSQNPPTDACRCSVSQHVIFARSPAIRLDLSVASALPLKCKNTVSVSWPPIPAFITKRISGLAIAPSVSKFKNGLEPVVPIQGIHLKICACKDSRIIGPASPRDYIISPSGVLAYFFKIFWSPCMHSRNASTVSYSVISRKFVTV